jgi:predicted oxidoreductase
MESTPQSTVLDGGGLIDYCRLEGITLQAWSPLQGSEGVFLDNPAYAELNAVIDGLAARYAVTPLAIAVAWITRHPAGMQVVLGTTTPSRVVEAAAGADIVLTRAEWYSLVRAAGYIVP